MTPKKLHRFLVSEIPRDLNISDPHTIYQAHSVLKLRPGEHIVIFENGGDDIETKILSIHKKGLSLEKISEKENPVLPKKVSVAISITKGATFEFAVQKLTEVGVQNIIPIISDRTVKQNIRLDRIQKISDEALEQSGGNNQVKIYEPMTLKESFEKFSEPKIILDAYAKNNDIPSGDCILYIGPEGGWSEKDEEIFKQNTHTTLSLGTKILRTETAAIIGAHKILWH